MKKSLISLAATCAPLPSTTPVLPRLQGSVVDAETRVPIPAATVTAVRAGYTRRATTSASGQFTLRPASQWHYLVYIGSPGVAPVPWHLKGEYLPATISASAPGYQESRMTFPPREENSLSLTLPEVLQIPLHR